jgi:hypothetical protein
MKKKTTKKKSKKQIDKSPKIKTEMSGKNLTIYAGLLPVLNFMNKLNFKGKIKDEVSIERNPNALYAYQEVVKMIVIGLISGATAMEHIVTICKDKVLSRIAGWSVVPVSTTLSRIIKRSSFGTVVKIENLIHCFRGRVWKNSVRSGKKLKSALNVMTLDVDSTVGGVCGNQEGAEKGYNPKKRGQKAYHPIIAMVAETKEIFHSWFRCGSAYTSNGIVEFMKECMSHVRRGVRVIFRGDSGFFSGNLLDYLDLVGAGYLIKVKLRNLYLLLAGQSWISIPGHSGWEQADFQYGCAGWLCTRRFVAVRQLIKVEKGLFDMPVYEYFCYVTTEMLSPYEVHRKYGERATCETWIEECKNQMRAGNIRTSEFLANAVLFQCAVLAYNILKWMGLLTGGEVSRWEVKTIRLNLIRVAGKLVDRGHQLTLKLPEQFIHQEKWLSWERMSLSVNFW